MSGPHVAYAVVRDDPPVVLMAEDLDVLHRALAVHFVAQTDPRRVSEDERERLQAALLEERWSDAVDAWIRHSGVAVDVHTGPVLTANDLPEDLIGAQLQFAPLYNGR